MGSGSISIKLTHDQYERLTLDMRQAHAPEYEEWLDANFVAEGPGSYVREEGITYTEDELEWIYGVLSQEAGDPRVSRLFDRAEIVEER